MIKLERNITPVKLTPTFVLDRTLEFIANGTNVWNFDWLKEALLELSNGKCAYCECSLKEESKYMEVEHFENKAKNPRKVLEWENLLPSCKKCNGSKGSHDVITEPIINPFVDNPSNHLKFRLFRFISIDAKGNNTIDVLNLNDTERAVLKRFEVGMELEKTIDTAQERLQSFELNSNTINKNRLLGIVRNILLECQKGSIYSATCSTILQTSPIYLGVRQKMQSHEIWSIELEALHEESCKLAI